MKLPATYKNAFLFLLTVIALFSLQSYTPQPQQKQQKRRKIVIDDAASLSYNEKIIANAQRLIGHVKLHHQGVVMTCDSAYSYTDKNMVEAFGNVHIVQGDTLNLYGQFVKYDGDSRMAKVRRDVKLVNKTITLTTDSLDFNMNTNIGYYNHGGKIVDTANVLTSWIGRYYADRDLFFFKDSVKVTNKDFVMHADTLEYQSEKERVIIVGPTTIIGTRQKGKLFSRSGWYDTQTNISELYKDSRLERNDQILEGDTLYYNKTTGDGRAFHQVKLTDLKNHTVITGKRAIYNEISDKAMVTDSALFMQYSQKDTLFMHADTLRSVPDTSLTKKEDKKIFLAYYGVRFFRADLQGECDSLAYRMKDSTIEMYHDPVLWSQNNQMTADVVKMTTHEKSPDIVNMEKNAFIISEEDSAKFNQISGKDMIGYIRNNNLYKVEVNGNGRSIYFAKDKDKYIGLNRVESSNINIYLIDGHINNITFITRPDAKMLPLDDVNTSETRLEGFEWRPDERPKNRYDIFQKPQKKSAKEKKAKGKNVPAPKEKAQKQNKIESAPKSLLRTRD
jgi:lipopolysaccharide export system protein LptA